MGVVIPEGIEALHHASTTPSSPSSTSEESDSVPTRTIALCLLSGFTLMLVIEQLLPASAHHQSPIQLGHNHARTTLFEEDDIEQLELGPAPGDQYPDPTAEPDPAPRASMNRRSGSIDSIPIKRGPKPVDDSNANGKAKDANPGAITLGLVIHSIADGLALGASARSGQNALEAIVFLAIIVHKGMLYLSFPPACKYLTTSGTYSTYRAGTFDSAHAAPPTPIRTAPHYGFCPHLAPICTHDLLCGRFPRRNRLSG